MAYPVIESRTKTDFTTNPTTFAANLPAVIDAGELLLLMAKTEDENSIVEASVSDSTSDAWTSLEGPTGSTTEGSALVFAKVADGDEDSGTVTFTTLGSGGCAQAYVYRISGWGGTIATDIDIAVSTAYTISSTADPEAVTAGWGSDTNLFLVSVHLNDDDATTAAASTGYGNLQSASIGNGGNNSATMAIFDRELTASSDNPGTITLSESERWLCCTMVIKPAASDTTVAVTAASAAYTAQSVGPLEAVGITAAVATYAAQALAILESIPIVAAVATYAAKTVALPGVAIRTGRIFRDLISNMVRDIFRDTT